MENRVKNTSLEIYNPVGEREKHTQIKEVEKEREPKKRELSIEATGPTVSHWSVCLYIFHSRRFPVDGRVLDLHVKENSLSGRLAMSQQ